MKALVTGGGGFLGGAIVRQLLARRDEVRSFSRGDYPELRELGVEVRRGDLADGHAVSTAVEGCDIVFHAAAKAGIWGPYQDYYRANVLGTQKVIDACRKHRIERLVYTSSPSVVFNGLDMEGVDESAPYPRRFHAHYPRTKAQAEEIVLQANSRSLATVALRPHLIWGPGDNHLMPRIVARGKVGALRQIGQKPLLVDCIYVDNAAHAHLLAADRLHPGAAIAGKAYFISQGDPRPLWDLINLMLKAADVPPVDRHISPRLAYAAGWLFEWVYRLFRIRGEPRMTRFLAGELSTAHWFNISAARRDLGYEPILSIDEGIALLEKRLLEQNNAPAGNATANCAEA
jgi:nucleoside-diphosphate-sugar epimerase